MIAFFCAVKVRCAATNHAAWSITPPATGGNPQIAKGHGDAPVQAVVSVSGSPVTPEPAASNGFKIERNYFTLDGKPAGLPAMKLSGEDFERGEGDSNRDNGSIQLPSSGYVKHPVTIEKPGKYRLIIKAGAADQEIVKVLGVDIAKVWLMVFGLGCAIAGLSGILASPTRSVNPEMGIPILAESFVVTVVGGMGSAVGAVVAGLLVGVVYSMTSLFFPDLPTVAEAGLPGAESETMYGLLAPSKTPRPLIHKLGADIVAVLKKPDTPWPVPESTADALALMGGFCFALTNALLRKLHDSHSRSANNALQSLVRGAIVHEDEFVFPPGEGSGEFRLERRDIVFLIEERDDD